TPAAAPRRSPGSAPPPPSVARTTDWRRCWLHTSAPAAGAPTGFRARALAGLTPADFDLAADVPAVVLPARLAKNKKTKVQPLAADVAGALRAYLDGRPKNAPVWPGGWKEDAAKMLRADLAEAG